MEKIYMQDSEDSSSSSSRFSSSSKMFRFSVVLSFFVAIFAIISLIAAGFNQISYSASLDDALIFYQATYERGDPIVINASGNGIFTVPLYLANSFDIADENAVPIFCVEHYADIADDSNYVRGDNVNDIGLAYILNQSSIMGGPGIVKEDFVYTSNTVMDATYLRRMVETYATQIAIWVYMYEKYYLTNPTVYVKNSLANPGDDHSTAATNYARIKSANVLSVSNYDIFTSDIGIGNNFYGSYIEPLVQAAKNYKSLKQLTVSKANNTISKVGDDTYYQSAPISVSSNPSEDLVGYDVYIEGIPNAFVVDETGNPKNTGFLPGEKFYVRVPTKDVSQQTGKVTVSVLATLNNYLTGSYYVGQNDNLQRVVTVTSNQGYESSSLIIDFVGAPDTGMSKTQTIFFIGLVVLLCGIGIIYANAKPVEIES